MALKFYEREKLLNNDDGFSANRSIIKKGSTIDSISNGFGTFGSPSSSFSSPFGSELSSTETESEEDNDNDFISELTRKMADYMLDEEDEEKALNTPTEHHSEKNQSTLNRIPTSVPSRSIPAFSDHQPRAVHFYNLDDQPSVKHQGFASWGRRVNGTDLTQQLEQNHKKQHSMQNSGGRAGAAGGFRTLAAAWPPLQQSRQLQKQQQVGSGMRAVFLGGPSSRSGSCGTGVFLPRGISNPPEVRKKSECSTVLIPAKVIQALQLHYEDMNTSRSQQDVGKAQITDPAVDAEEMDLPQEWTY